MKDKTSMTTKLKNRSAFTLAEVLVAVLIMLMVSAVMAGGIPAAKRAYEGVVKAANAETLLSTTVSALRNELGTAGFVQQNGDSVIFYNSLTHTASEIYKASGVPGVQDGMIMYREYAEAKLKLGDDDTALSKAGGETTTLVPRNAIEKDQYVTYDSVSITTDGVVTFNGLSVKDKNNQSLAPLRENNKKIDISVRALSGKVQ